MKKNLLALAFFFSVALSAQHTISGTFTPADEYTWIIAYQLKAGAQTYIADAPIKNGSFEMSIPQTAEPGMYRMVYAVPQEEFYFDLIFNGKESVDLSFDATKGVEFKSSVENQIFNAYFTDINSIQTKIISFYNEGNTDAKKFQELTTELHSVQRTYEEKSKGLRVNEFIKANTPYTPTSYESILDYVTNGKAAYFKHIDFSNPVLQASGFLSNKASNYVFTALPLQQMTPLEKEVAMQSNVKKVSDALTGVSNEYKLSIYYTLWSQAASYNFNDLSDFIYSEYLKSLATLTNDQTMIPQIEAHNRLRIGEVAPELVWKNNNELQSLSELGEARNFLLVFWSSTCGHCLRELPSLHEKLKENRNVKVIAIGLEDDEANWKLESAKLESFDHAIALGKWESDYAKLYNIEQTPTYFILDAKKRIIHKPENGEDAITLLGSEN